MGEEESTIWDGLGQKWQGGPAPGSPEKCPRTWIGSVSGVRVGYAPIEGFSLCIVRTLNRILTLRGVHVRLPWQQTLSTWPKRVREYVNSRQDLGLLSVHQPSQSSAL